MVNTETVIMRYRETDGTHIEGQTKYQIQARQTDKVNAGDSNGL